MRTLESEKFFKKSLQLEDLIQTQIDVKHFGLFFYFQSIKDILLIMHIIQVLLYLPSLVSNTSLRHSQLVNVEQNLPTAYCNCQVISKESHACISANSLKYLFVARRLHLFAIKMSIKLNFLHTQPKVVYFSHLYLLSHFLLTFMIFVEVRSIKHFSTTESIFDL